MTPTELAASAVWLEDLIDSNHTLYERFMSPRNESMSASDLASETRGNRDRAAALIAEVCRLRLWLAVASNQGEDNISHAAILALRGEPVPDRQWFMPDVQAALDDQPEPTESEMSDAVNFTGTNLIKIAIPPEATP